MAKVGDKFIIEIGEVFHGNVVPDTAIYKDHELYRVKGFDSLVFDEHELDKLEKYEKLPSIPVSALEVERKAGYEEGLNDAWESARKLNGMGYKESCGIFGSKYQGDEFWQHYTVAEAISKIKAYEEQKKAEERESHLCNSCKYLYPECPSLKNDARFGKYTDSIIECHKYEQKKADEEIKVGDEVCKNEVIGTAIHVLSDSEILVAFFDMKYKIVEVGKWSISDVEKSGRYCDIEGILKAMREE